MDFAFLGAFWFSISLLGRKGNIRLSLADKHYPLTQMTHFLACLLLRAYAELTTKARQAMIILILKKVN